MASRKRPRQTSLDFRRHGGARRGAGRKPKGDKAGVPHRPRADLTGREPVLVTLKILSALTSLRTTRVFRRIERSLTKAAERNGGRIVEYSVQRDHVHLVVETNGRLSLARVIQGLAVRLARGLNRIMGRCGRVFADRYHSRVLRTPRQVRNALAYVLCNARKHRVAPRDPRWLDPFSSARLFRGWSVEVGEHRFVPDACSVAPARTWLLRVGWHRLDGAIDPAHVPGTLP
jgi:REP element-mobilizing transposase RayT